MRNYQLKRNNPYHLPHNLYMSVIYVVRDYDRLKAERDDIILSGGVSDGMPRSSQPGDPTMNKAIRLERVNERINAVNRALEQIPPKYRRGVMDNVRYNSPYPYGRVGGGERTWGRWRARFLYYVAIFLNQI